MHGSAAGLLSVFLLLSPGLQAQTAPQQPAGAGSTGTDPAGTATVPPAAVAKAPLLVRIEILDRLSSADRKRGDTFALRLAEDVTLPDGSILPAGTPGGGEVVHAAKSGIGGKPGELILAARFLDGSQGRFRLRALRLAGVGKDRGNAALGIATAAEVAVPGAALLSLFIHGGQFVVPPGAQAVAKLEPTPLVLAAVPRELPDSGNPSTPEEPLP